MQDPQPIYHPRRWRLLAVGGAPVMNWPNLITAVRTAAAIILGFLALVQADWVLLAWAYGTYWVGDMADGFTARRLGQETRLGAVFDILSDRACSTICIGALLVIRPEFALPLAVYFIQFMVVDALGTLAFLHWDLVSPNYFYRVDRLTYNLNWSPPAKAANTSLLLVLLFVLPLLHVTLWVATAVAVAQLAVKLFTAYRLASLATAKPTAKPTA